MADVFISYSREDLPTFSILAQSIKEAGCSLWWDADLPAHKNYRDVIMEDIVNA
ncbi:MAG: TIR domain-containing protein, partial [Erythrobacter sp.]|nr:TIR domain-containing protein [Erythrobacter sp.]